MNTTRFLIFAIGFLLLTHTAQGQYDLKLGSFNHTFVPQTATGSAATPAGPPSPFEPPPNSSQFTAVADFSGVSGPIFSSVDFASRYPANSSKSLVLVSSNIGGVFTSGATRYSLGDVITPPLVKVDGVTPAEPNYWREKPVMPGEMLKIAGANHAKLPLGAVTVTAASLSSTTVTVINNPPVPELVVGATLLGQPVTRILGTTVTLAGLANAAITSNTVVPITPALEYYYSPHSEKVYASQPGRVKIIWVTRLRDANENFQTLTEEFAVSTSTQRPLRPIFWTEGSFDGPIVQVTDSRITTISLAYNYLVPKAVPEEVSIPGYAPVVSNLTTLTFERFNGAGQIKAYNVEGRILIEYLGNIRAPGNVYESLGTELVSIMRVPQVYHPAVYLGQEITPHDYDVRLTAAPLLGTAQNAASYYGTQVKANGSSAYFAERESSPPRVPDDGFPLSTEAYNKVVFYWLEEGSYSIKWPKFQNRYWLRWSPRLGEYAHYTVEAGSTSPETGLSFTGNSLPQLVYQDDPSQEEARLDLQTQRLVVTLDPSGDLRNRSLLKFSNTSKVWYVNLYTQAETRKAILAATSNPTIITVSGVSANGLFVGMSVTGTGITGTATILSIPNDTQIVLSQRVANGTYSFLYGGTTTLSSTASTGAAASNTLTVASTAGLEADMIVTGPGIGAFATIAKILSDTQFELSQEVNTSWADFNFTVEADGISPIDLNKVVGKRIDPPRGHEIGGYIVKGTNYYPAGYLNPFIVGVPEANKGAIIPVNARPGHNVLNVRWFKKFYAPSADFQDLYVPGKRGRYTVDYPVSTDTLQIVIAQGVGTDDLTGAKAEGSVYYQNDVTKPGYNPNEEHALMLAPRAYALRDDLNITSGPNYTSAPFVLIAYKELDGRPKMEAYKVVREDATYRFDYTATAGTLLVKPYPLPLMPQPLVGQGASRASKDLEILFADMPGNGTVSDTDAYKKFTFQDRKGFTWVHRGPHDAGAPTLSMKLYYLSRPGFWIPGPGEVTEGTVLPFLRKPARSGTNLNVTSIDNGQIDEPLTIVYRPAWPTGAPELRVGETLTLPKFGLPQMRGQKSAEVYYEQSIANALTSSKLTKNSVTLHDPTREKAVALDDPTVGLSAVPSAIKTTSYQGKTYFQMLPPHLQQRIYIDPLRGAKGTLVFTGSFHDKPAGEDYLDLNLLTAAEEALLKGLVPAGAAHESNWHAAIDALKTRVETFKPDPAQFGSYIVDTSKNQDVGENDLARITDANTAVDSYAVTATGQGKGFVSMVFGNGNAFTPEGDPVQVQVFKISNQLYVGDLKVVTSSNPLDEQVTLRHSGDFAGKPEDYEFEWRWATGAASAPKTYATVITKRIGDALSSTQNWLVVRDPGAVRPTAAQYTGSALPFTPARTENVRPVNYMNNAQGQPTATVIDATSYTAADIAAGFPSLVAKSESGVDFSAGIPEDIVFSAQLGTKDGCVLYVNGRVAMAYNAPTPQFTVTNASSDLTSNGLSKQFRIEPSYFSAGPNVIEVAIYTAADPNAQSALSFLLEAGSETDLVDADVTPATQWESPSDPARKNTNTALIGGSPLNPFGGPQFVINDRWFTMRYRPKEGASNVLGTPWSRWMPPQFVEGWVKRVLAAINPFEQRVKDLYNNQANTDVSVLTQTGTRWEGDVALTLDNINDVGLIAIYETVLNRAKSMSIDANTNDSDTNNALILAAGYLNDLYTLLGNEAYADAANPTISLDDQTSITEVNSSRFSFEGQVANSLDEELALLKGRDDSVSPGVRSAPAYNRLFWNFTRGINGGEVIYAVNYNIKEKVGSSTANGVIDEADAQRMFPQGHGDAYGHYLTALTGYYRLLTNTNFTWSPRAEAVTVLGQPVTVDFQDERKFAAAAGNVARVAQQVAALVYRQTYKDAPGAGWEHFHDAKAVNSATNVKSAQGLDEWVSRSAQGALFHWVVANAMVPDVDTYHTGVQKIDRTTVPEIPELATAMATFQNTIDNANAHLNPLGLSPGAIAFDLSPTLLVPSGDTGGGRSHFEQIYDRSLAAVLNAGGAFNQAATMTRSLRNQENQLDDYNTVIVQQEKAYVNQLIDIFGRPYSGEIGAGKLYAQGYAGPDLLHWFIVDRPNDLVDTKGTFTITVHEATENNGFTNQAIPDILGGFTSSNTATKTVTVQPSQWVQYNDVWKAGGLGSRAETGELQAALQAAQQSWLALSEAAQDYDMAKGSLRDQCAVFADAVEYHANVISEMNSNREKVLILKSLVLALNTTADSLDALSGYFEDKGDVVAEFLPKIAGALVADPSAPARAAAMESADTMANVLKVLALISKAGAGATEIGIANEELNLARRTTELGFSHEEVQLAHELDNAYRSLVTGADGIMQLTLTHQQALQQVQNVVAKGNRILAEREVFRQRAAAIIQGYRTKDLGFRIFRNEALEQYRSLFDLASRYTYLAAKSYDYETGLLGTPQGQAVFAKIVASRSLGDLTGGVPQSTVSTLGDAGLAGTMAQLNADFSVAKGRLGINNPDQYGTVFSLRSELYRIRTDQAIIADDDAWRQSLEQHIVANVMTDADVATQCRNIKKPDGTPVPGIVIPFSTAILHGRNFFGLDYLPGDHNYTPSSYSTKIYNVGISLPGYIGMDTYATGSMNSGAPASNDPNALGATPYAYLIPCGNDYMLAPPLGDTNTLRAWTVHDQALPLPYNLGANDFNSTQFFNANRTLSEQPWIIRKHQAFRAVSDPSLFYSSVPAEFTNSRLIGRSVWNDRWKIVIPAYTLHSNEQEGLNRFAASVKDIQLFLRTYSHSGN